MRDAGFDAMANANETLGWTTPMKIAEIADPFGADDPSLTDDLLEIYFGSTRTGGLGMEDIWAATRTSIDLPFGTPAPVVALNSVSSETTMKITGNGKAIYFSSDRGAAGHDIYVATRTDRDQPWTTPTRVAELSTTVGDSGSLRTERSAACRVVQWSQRGAGSALHRDPRIDRRSVGHAHQARLPRRRGQERVRPGRAALGRAVLLFQLSHAADGRRQVPRLPRVSNFERSTVRQPNAGQCHRTTWNQRSRSMGFIRRAHDGVLERSRSDKLSDLHHVTSLNDICHDGTLRRSLSRVLHRAEVERVTLRVASPASDRARGRGPALERGADHVRAEHSPDAADPDDHVRPTSVRNGDARHVNLVS